MLRSETAVLRLERNLKWLRKEEPIAYLSYRMTFLRPFAPEYGQGFGIPDLDSAASHHLLMLVRMDSEFQTTLYLDEESGGGGG
jgi:hypothetical protein